MDARSEKGNKQAAILDHDLAAATVSTAPMGGAFKIDRGAGRMRRPCRPYGRLTEEVILLRTESVSVDLAGAHY